MDRPKGIRLRTPAATEDDFVAAFHAFSDETSIFVPTDKLYPTNTNCYFSLELADEAPMLRGLGVVIDSWSTTENPFNQPGMRVGISQLTAQSETIFDRMLAARPAVEKRGPRTRNAPMTQQQWGAVIAPPTQEMEIAIPFERPATEEPVRPVTREMRASLPPANAMEAAPIATLDDKATETQRYNVSLRLPARSPAAAAAAAAKSARTAAPPIPAGPQTTPLAIADLEELSGATPSSFDDDIRLPSSWWQARWWRDGSWRTTWWATTWRNAQWRKATWWKTAWGNAQWRKAAWWRDGSWRDAWWASWWRTAQWRKAAWWRDGSWRTALRNNRRTATVFAFGMLVGIFFTVVLRPSSDVTRDQVATADQASRARPVDAAIAEARSMDDTTAEPASSLATLPKVAPNASATRKRAEISTAAPATSAPTAATKSALTKAVTPQNPRTPALAKATAKPTPPNTTGSTATPKPALAKAATSKPAATVPTKPTAPTPASVFADATAPATSSALAKGTSKTTASPKPTSPAATTIAKPTSSATTTRSTALAKPTSPAATTRSTALAKPTSSATAQTKTTALAKPSSAASARSTPLAKPTSSATAQTKTTTPVKPSATSSALAKPNTSAATAAPTTAKPAPGNVATTKPATKRGKRGCAALDCI